MIRATLAALVAVVCATAAPAQTIIRPKDSKPTARTEFQFTLTTPIHLLYLDVEAVRTELKLAREQAEKVDTLHKRWSEGAKQVDLERGTGGGDAGSLALETRKRLDEILTVAQLKRLDQVILRHREKEHGMSAVLSTVARDLKLSNEQQERFETLRRKRADRILEYLTIEERANAIHRSIHNANNDFVDAVEKLLTKEQDSRLMELLGEPLVAQIKLREPQAVALENNVVQSVYLGALIDKYGLEPEIIKNESVHKELKLSDDQIRKVKEFNVEWWTNHERRCKNGDTPVEAVAALHEFVLRDLYRIMTAPQQTRFDQIAMQYRRKIAGELAALGHPAARDFRDRETTSKICLGEPFEKILTAPYPAFRRALGEPFGGELKINSPLKITRSISVVRPNAALPVVETNRLTIAKFMLENSRRYRLDEEQVTRLKEIDEDLPKLRKLLHRELSQLPPSTDVSAARSMIPEVKAVEEFRKSVFEQCFNVLDKKQQSLWGAELRAARGAIIDY